jgi:hypothetical protein
VSGPGIAADIREEATRLAAESISSGLPARLFGGMAIWLRCPSVRQGPFARSYADLDFAVTASAVPKLKALLEGEGYRPDKFFNGMHGATRLYYAAPEGQWSIDVVIDELSMSHRLDLRGRLGGPAPTITPADLLLTKLQVWEITRKDLGDAICLLADHGLADGADADADVEGISLPRLRSVLGSDWGFCHTFERNLLKVAELWSSEPVDAASFDPAKQVEAIQISIDQAPKSRSWKLRSRVGERLKWYETPEEVRH